MAARYAIDGDVAAGNRAKTILLTSVGYFSTSGGATKPWWQGTFPGVMGSTYDMIRPLLSSSERTRVVNHLVTWVNFLRATANPVGSYNSYGGCADNWAFGIDGGIAMALLAVWGDVNRPGIEAEIQSSLLRIRDGFNDVVSPDGSYDEGPGYANYGAAWCVRVLHLKRGGAESFEPEHKRSERRLPGGRQTGPDIAPIEGGSPPTESGTGTGRVTIPRNGQGG